MRVFIAEKPSLGRAIADNLPGTQKKGDGFITMSNGDIVSWAAGHLLSQEEPKFYLKDKNPFDIANLPVIPEKFVLTPRTDNKTKKVDAGAVKQIKVLESLVKNATSIGHVGDPDREGQSIVDNLLRRFKTKVPVERVWLNAMDTASVKKALANMKPNTDPLYVGMYNASIARSNDDWLVGMNLSPSITTAARKSGFNGFISIGRVQTPTLGLVVARDLEIENFVAKNFFAVTADVSVEKGKFNAKYKIPENMAGLDSEGRIADKSAADAIAARVKDQSGTITKYETKREKELAPLPFSLSALQIYANSKFGYGAQEVLDTCQALYETHALTSYPRSDCEFLPLSQHGDAPGILSHLKNNFAVASGANTSIKTRVFNDAKVTAHHAIIPTGKAANLNTLKKTEKDIYEAIALRYIANFYPDYVFDKTNVETTFNAKDVFSTSGRVDISQGWRTVLPSMGKKNDDEAQSLPAMTLNEPSKVDKVSVDSKKTNPPAYFTEGTLIEAMTNVHKFVTNPEIKKRLKEVAGIGTEATRAGVMERLFSKNLLSKDGKKIKSSGVGKAIIAGMPLVLKDPGITAMMEDNLQQISEGKLSVEAFIESRARDITKLVDWCRNNTINIPKEFHGPARGSSPSPSGKSSGKSGYKAGKDKMTGDADNKPAYKTGTLALSVPFAEKDEAKKLGARWNGDLKAWCIEKGADTKPFAQWLPKNKPKM